MDLLQPELISSIFLALLPIPPCSLQNSSDTIARRRSQEITTIRLVSKTWDSIILNTPEHWSYITVSPRGTDALRYLPRSKAVLLHIRISLWSSDKSESLRAAVEALWYEAHRWTTYCAFTLMARDSFPWFQLIPPFPVRRLREASLLGDQNVDLEGPELQRLHEWGFKSNIRFNGAPGLRFLATKRPANNQEWEQLLLISQQCPLLESLRLTEYATDEVTRLQLEETFPGTGVARPTFSNLRELKLVSKRVAFDLMTYLHTPALSLLVIRHHISPVPLTIPPSCATLDHIRFTYATRVKPIQETLSTFPPAQLQSLTVEIEDTRFIRHARARDEIRWLEEHVSLRWFDIPDEEKRRCTCPFEHPE
ncbi:hypothetical protein M407DRAFT_21109 [Tulasnella calospora MUT 4182]|uniref:F-box domain-containing protein n=1 Tax=Tulasnella calospora MUT 4182 TaxID=1051891 RepID=A0A0C3M875_9AGAM|nr:hypothetical protein M407DRAFT_21109 [Tulasnella calospora MUT 4182]